MCDTCGCGDPEVIPIEIQDKILAGNDRQATHNREHFASHGVLAVNLMGSPGAGKTAILEATARADNTLRLGALAGDLETDRDAQRLEAAGIRSVTINTISACHLDAKLVHHALHEVDLHDHDILFIENVGNLVCPAVYDLGQQVNVVALSVTEGEDKPVKYPVMFRKADLVLVTKVDLLPHLPGVSLDKIADSLARVMPDPKWIAVSAVTGHGMAHWLTWLATQRRPLASAAPHTHHHHDRA
ncbi:MAG: hydrogenase nickel incorporation protein HypB [Thermoanaerobaculia bacterium]